MNDVSKTPMMPVGRRTVLTASLGAVTVGLVPATGAHANGRSLVTLTPGDLSDPAVAIQEAIDQVHAAGGGTVRLPEGIHELTATLWLRSNVALVGDGRESTVLREAPTLGARPIIMIIGSADQRVENVALRRLTIRNGSATTTAAPKNTVVTPLSVVGKDGIVAEYVDGLVMEDLLVTEIGGQYGFRCKMARRVTCRATRFFRCTYAAFVAMVETEHLLVDQCEFDTITTMPPVYPNQYLFATGYDKLNQGEYLVRDVTVQNSRFTNNPHWQAMNTHGGERITFRNNHCENVLVGVIVSNVVGAARTSALHDITIEDNTFLRGTASHEGKPSATTTCGIVAAGHVTELGRTIVIRRNRVVGFGGNHPAMAAIRSYRVVDAVIEDNDIEDFHQFGIVLFQGSFGAVIRRNRFAGVRSAIPGWEGRTATIAVPVDGQAHGIEISGNEVLPVIPEHRPRHFLWSAGPNINVVLSHNRIDAAGIAAEWLSQPDYFPVDRVATPDQNLILRRGERVTDLRGRTVNRCLLPRTGYGGLDTVTVLTTATATSGSTAITIAPSFLPTLNSEFFAAYGMLPPGMNVTVAGAGPEGGDLDAQVIRMANATTIILDRPVATSVVGATVRRQLLTWQRRDR